MTKNNKVELNMVFESIAEIFTDHNFDERKKRYLLNHYIQGYDPRCIKCYANPAYTIELMQFCANMAYLGATPEAIEIAIQSLPRTDEWFETER